MNEVIRFPKGLPPEGVFRAVTTRDAAALARDGEPYWQARFIRDSERHVAIYEIRFADGDLMLVSARDLDSG